jgi:hypothetical protein
MGMGMGGCYIRSLRLCRGGVNCTQKSRQHGFFWLLVFFSGVLLWCSSGVVLPRRTQDFLNPTGASHKPPASQIAV